MHEYDLILTIAAGLGFALALGYLTQRFGLSPIVGYLLAGTLVGSHTPGFVADAGLANQLAEVGVILLMFGVGLQFHVEELLAVRRIAIPGAVAQSLVATLLGALLVRAFGWTWPEALIFGMALAVASTVVLVRVLSDNNHLHTQSGHIAIGWLVVEDMFTVGALVILPALFSPTGQSGPLWISMGLAGLKVGALIAFIAVVGTRLIPRLLDRVAATRSRELFTLAVLVIALGIAVGSALVFNVSMALGAFLAGMVVGRSDYSLRAASEALPMRDAFAVLFFVSVGMLLNPGALLESPVIVLGALAVVLIAKPTVALILVWAMRYPLKTALTVAIALAQIGEFSFILASMGNKLGVLPDEATNVLVAAAVVSIVLNPMAYWAITPIERWVQARPRLAALLDRSLPTADVTPSAPLTVSASHRAIVVGFGPTGRTVVRLLRDNGITPTVIDLNIEVVRELRHIGIDAVYGDASRPEILDAAGIGNSASLVLGSAGMANGAEIIRAAKAINPGVRVLARAAYLREIAELQRLGANRVYSGEGEVALAFVEDILSDLGATPEQIDRERARAHDELAGRSAVSR